LSKIQFAPVVLKELYLKSNNENIAQNTPWQERIWILTVAGQAGFMIAFPVLLGLAIGFFLDRQFGTYIIFSLLISMAGFGAGIFLVFRWVKTTVKTRLDKMRKDK